MPPRLSLQLPLSRPRLSCPCSYSFGLKPLFTFRMASAKSSQTPSEDYTKWSHADLIQRVTELEARLRSQTTAHQISHPSAYDAQLKKKAKRPFKPFDPSKYSTRHIALKFAYFGAAYNGFEHHANNTTPLPTVEEELWRALRKTKLIFPTFKEGQREDEVSWEGCEYSKCGRTDRGVSAFGQVIALRMRSSQPKESTLMNGSSIDITFAHGEDDLLDASPSAEKEAREKLWHHIEDELPYVQLLNRVLPPDIRILAWCPTPPHNFSARFNCKERRYRYFFTNPAYMPDPSCANSSHQTAWLDVGRMQEAAKKLEGLHDFRNFCKVDPSKQITNFERRIFSAGIHPVSSDQEAGAFLSHPPFGAGNEGMTPTTDAKLQVYYFEVRGSAFLWHQVRHMVAILFLIGQGFESPAIVDDLLDIQKNPAKPVYDMACDIPLVLWDCIFPDLEQTTSGDHETAGQIHKDGYDDALEWLYIGDQAPAESETTKQSVTVGMQDRKYGSMGIMEDLWALWRKRKVEEVLAGSLMNIVARQGQTMSQSNSSVGSRTSSRVFDGSEMLRNAGTYVPIAKRDRMELPDTVNARYAVRKGLNGNGGPNVANDVDE